MTTIAVIGSAGQVGREIVRVLTAAGHRAIALNRNEFDLADLANTPVALPSELDLVVNAAAYTAVDRSEDEPAIAHTVNAAGAGLVAQASARAGVPIIHFSTDYVFDGTKPGPYLEEDATNPLGVYGRTKLEGERLLAAANPRHVILRTAWVFSSHRQNFVKTMLKLAVDQPRVRVVDDQQGNPTSAADLAVVVAGLVPRLIRPDAPSDAFGLFHAVNAGAVTWCGFAREIMTGAHLRGAPSVPIDAIRTSEYPTRTRRPAYSLLATTKLANVHGITMRPWTEALSCCLDELIGPVHDGALGRP